MRRLASAILEPNLERTLAKLDSLGDAQTSLTLQLDAVEAMLAAVIAVEPYESDAVGNRINNLRKRLTTLEQSLKQVNSRVESIKRNVYTIS